MSREELLAEYQDLQAISRTMTAEQWCRTPEAERLDELYDLLASIPRHLPHD